MLNRLLACLLSATVTTGLLTPASADATPFRLQELPTNFPTQAFAPPPTFEPEPTPAGEQIRSDLGDILEEERTEAFWIDRAEMQRLANKFEAEIERLQEGGIPHYPLSLFDLKSIFEWTSVFGQAKEPFFVTGFGLTFADERKDERGSFKQVGAAEQVIEVPFLRMKERHLPRHLANGIFEEQEAVVPFVGDIILPGGHALTEEELAALGLEWVKDDHEERLTMPVFVAGMSTSRKLTIPFAYLGRLRLVEEDGRWRWLVTGEEKDYSHSVPILAIQYKGIGGLYRGQLTVKRTTYTEPPPDWTEYTGKKLESMFPGMVKQWTNPAFEGKRGIFLDAHVRDTQVAASGTGHHEQLAVDRDPVLFANGALVSAVTLGYASLLSEDQMRQLGVGHLLPLGVSIRAILDDTRQLMDVAQPGVYETFLRCEMDSDLHDAILKHLSRLAFGIGTNMAACLKSNLTLPIHDLGMIAGLGYARNLSPRGYLRDTGDLVPIQIPQDGLFILRAMIDALLHTAAQIGIGSRDLLKTPIFAVLVERYLATLPLSEIDRATAESRLLLECHNISEVDSDKAAYVGLNVFILDLWRLWLRTTTWKVTAENERQFHGEVILHPSLISFVDIAQWEETKRVSAAERFDFYFGLHRTLWERIADTGLLPTDILVEPYGLGVNFRLAEAIISHIAFDLFTDDDVPPAYESLSQRFGNAMVLTYIDSFIPEFRTKGFIPLLVAYAGLVFGIDTLMIHIHTGDGIKQFKRLVREEFVILPSEDSLLGAVLCGKFNADEATRLLGLRSA